MIFPHINAIITFLAAVLLMGGGQGSRLGFEHPKGLYNIQLPSQKAIYQIHAEKLLRMMKLAKAKFPQNIQGDERDCLTWFIMTSKGKNHEETSAFFEKNNYFGLKKERVILFPQVFNYNDLIILILLQRELCLLLIKMEKFF